MANELLYIKTGRWLCSLLYRDAREVATIDGVHQILEAGSQLDTAFFELLAGAYRFPQFLSTKRSGLNVKWSKLGVVVWPGVLSIDGVGDVRAKEVLLYWYVGEKFHEYLLKGPLK